MICVFNELNEVVGNFRSYGELADHICVIESAKARFSMAVNPGWGFPPFWGQEYWGFMVYRHEALKTTCSCMRKIPLTGLEREAFYRGLDLVEIHYGDLDHPVQVLLTEDVDMGALQKNWCLDYCKAHRCTVLET